MSGFSKILVNWCTDAKCKDIDGLAAELKRKGLTRNNLATSLASKILLLNNPYKIFPSDSLAKKALDYKDRTYVKYRDAIANFKQDENLSIEKCKKIIEPFAKIIEEKFRLKDISIIRENRFIDKLLWTMDKDYKIQYEIQN